MLDRLVKRLKRTNELPDVVRALQDLAVAQHQHAASVQARLKSLTELVNRQATTKDATEIFHAIRALVALVEGASPGPDDDGAMAPSTARVFRALDAVAQGQGPIVVGPWTGEVGFEVLYWVPFLEWFRTRWRVRPERLVIVSRGGVESWYGMAGARYVDIFSLVSPDTFRERVERDEQRRISAFDRDLFDASARCCSLDRPAQLHPHLMYQALAPFWKDEAGFGLISRFTHHRRLEPVDDPVVHDLPDGFVAVRFYFSNCFPDKPANREFALAVIAALAEQRPVVVLRSGLRVDDHADFVPARPGIISVPVGAPERNLAVQSAVIGRARAFVGTYGGYSYVAPFYGIPSVGFYSQQSFKVHHLYVAHRALEQLGRATVTPVNIVHADVMHMATGRVAVTA
jgi:hypothetical protein